MAQVSTMRMYTAGNF